MRHLRFQVTGLLLACAALAACGPSLAKSKPVSWKGIDDALLLVDNNPVKSWGVYQAGNKRDPLLLEMGSRFLLIRVHERQVFEIDKSKVQSKADELLFDVSDHPAEPLATTDWDAEDTEAVFRIRAKISGENHLLDLELPHQLDLSGLSPQPRRR